MNFLMAAILIVFASCSCDAVAVIPHPVLLIPGLGGSQMQARINRSPSSSYWYCQTSSDWYRIWMSITSLMPLSVNCFIDNFRLMYNEETEMSENVPGVETRVEDFGNVTTMEYFFDMNLDFAKFFQPIISSLESRGYERTRSLRAAQYDFRKAPYESNFENLTSLIEQMYIENHNKSIVMVCHSYGCTHNYYFLTKIATASWKRKYIKSWVTLGAAFGGSVQALQAITSGYNLNMRIGFLTSSLARDLAATFSSVYSSLPVASVFKDQPLFIIEGLKFNAKDFPTIFRLLNVSSGEAMWRKSEETIDDSFPHPGIEVHCLRASGTETIETLVYNSMTDFPDSPIILYGPGDGSVNKRSSDVCLKWINHTDFFTQEFDASVDHMSFVQGNQAADYIIRNVLHL